MANNIIYNLHDFRDVNDEMAEIIRFIDMYKNDYNITEANRYAESKRDILGDMMSPKALNEIEQGIIDVQKMTIAKKVSVIISSDYPTIFNNQCWIQLIEES